MRRIRIFLGLASVFISAVATFSVLAKDIGSLTINEHKYLYELGRVTTKGSEYDSILMLGFAENWKDIVEACSEKLQKTPDLDVDFYIVIRPDGSIANIVADEKSRTKNGNEKRDDSITCVAENLFYASYPNHKFSLFFWKFSYVPNLQSNLNRVSKQGFFNSREIWQSADTNFVASLSDDGRIYLCIGGANKSLKTIKVIGWADGEQSVRWGTTYMMFQNELVNINEELPDNAINYKVVTHQNGITLKHEKESVFLGKKLTSMPPICDRPI